MEIIETLSGFRYFDRAGREVHAGDTVKLNGVEKIVYTTIYSELGTDSTNPALISAGLAEVGEFGIYPFNELDDVEIVK